MSCKICYNGEEDFCKVHQRLLDKGWRVNGWEKIDNDYVHFNNKKVTPTDKRLNKAVREGKAESRPLSKLRSYWDKGGWHYKYIK